MAKVWEKNIILQKADKLAHAVYKTTRSFPSEERYGLTSQLRRAVISIVLNMIEGFSRFSQKEHSRFLEMAFGSLKETQYLIEFCGKEGFIKDDGFDGLTELCDEISRMLYSKIRTMRGKTR